MSNAEAIDPMLVTQLSPVSNELQMVCSERRARSSDGLLFFRDVDDVERRNGPVGLCRGTGRCGGEPQTSRANYDGVPIKFRDVACLSYGSTLATQALNP